MFGYVIRRIWKQFSKCYYLVKNIKQKLVGVNTYHCQKYYSENTSSINTRIRCEKLIKRNEHF